MRINEVGRRKMLKGSRKARRKGSSSKINSKPIFGLLYVQQSSTFLADLLDESMGNSFNFIDLDSRLLLLLILFSAGFWLSCSRKVFSVKCSGDPESQRGSELFMGFTTEINFLSSLGSSRRQIGVGVGTTPNLLSCTCVKSWSMRMWIFRRFSVCSHSREASHFALLKAGIWDLEKRAELRLGITPPQNMHPISSRKMKHLSYIAKILLGTCLSLPFYESQRIRVAVSFHWNMASSKIC